VPEEKVTFCRICEPLCGMVATVEDGRITKLRPDPNHPLSRGYARPKGIAMAEVQNDPDRVLHPLRRKAGVPPGAAGPDDFERVSWEEALDGIAARQAAHFNSPVDIAALARINDQLAAAAAEGAYARMASLNVEFHTALARASRNEMLQRFIDQVHQAVRRFKRTTFSEPGRADEAVREHVAIIEAIKNQDELAAEEAARRHMQHALAVRMAMELERE
jgi:hypothetical protein